MRVLKAGVTYFLLVFAGGWIMGPIRELWAVPHFGPTMGLLLEAVIMLIAMIVVRWFEVPQTLPAMISMGLVALGLLVPAEIAGVVLVRGQSLQDYLASYANGPGVILLIMFLLFATMPTLVTRAGSVSRPNDTAEAEDL
jgi:hypothetical protein